MRYLLLCPLKGFDTFTIQRFSTLSNKSVKTGVLYKARNFDFELSSRWRTVCQAQEEGRQVDHRRVQHRVLGPQRVRRPLRAAAVPAAEDLPDAATATIRGNFER